MNSDSESEPISKAQKLDSEDDDFEDNDSESPGYRKRYLPNNRTFDGPLSYKDLFDSPKASSSSLGAKEADEMKRLESVIETCIGVDMKPNAIRKVLNSFIANFGLDDKLVTARTTMYRKIDALFEARTKEQSDAISELKYIAFDERDDFTLFPKGQVRKEAHCSFVKEDGTYIDHATMTQRDAEAFKNATFKILEETGSVESLVYAATDGCATNSGWEHGAIRKLEEKLERVRTSQYRNS